MSCTSLVQNGSNPNCESYLKEVRAAIIMVASGQEFTPDELDNLATMKTMIAENTTASVVEFNGTEPTQAEVQTETTGFGTNYITSENSPTLMGYLKANACDFTDMLASYSGGTYEVLLYNAGGKLVATQSSSKIKGFKTQIWAHAYGAVGRENQTQQYQITLNFLDEVEWRKPSIVSVNYTLFDLNYLMPLGLNIASSAEMTGDTVSLPVSVRCIDNSELAEALTGNVLKSNVTGATITPTYNATTEVYDIVVTKTGGVALVYGEYVEGRLEVLDGSTIEKVTNVVKFNGND